MFRVAGASVAMGQAVPAVKAKATAVTLRNDEAGVAHAIDRLVGDRHDYRVAGICRSLMRSFRQFHAAASGPYSCTRSCTEFSAS